MADNFKPKEWFTITHMFKKSNDSGGIKHFDIKYNGPALCIQQGDYVRLKQREFFDESAPPGNQYSTTPPKGKDVSTWPMYTLEMRQPYPAEGGNYLAENDYASAGPSPAQSGNIKDDVPF